MSLGGVEWESRSGSIYEEERGLSRGDDGVWRSGGLSR